MGYVTTDPLGPQHRICLPCSVPRRDTYGEVLRDRFGFPIFHCDLCIARNVDRICECFLCHWLREDLT